MSDRPGLKRRLHQQEVVTELGQAALETADLDRLMHEACVAVAETLNTEYCKVLESLPGGQDVLLRQGIGWRDGLVGTERVPTDRDSQAGYTLLQEEPVIVEDLEEEPRFSGPELLTSHDVVSGISVIIGSVEDPWGVLGTHSTERRSFSQHDAAFVQNVANVLASAIDRMEREAQLNRQRRQWTELIDAVEEYAIFRLDRHGHVVTWNSGAEEIMGYEKPEIAGKHVSTFYPDADVADGLPERLLAEARETGTATHEGWRVKKDGMRFWADATITPLKDDAGDVQGFLKVTRDKTERREQEWALERANRRIELALSATDATVWEWELETDVVTTHPEPHGLFETTVRTSEEFTQSIHPDDRERVERALDEAIETEQPYHVEYRYLVGEEVRWAEDYGELFEPVGGNGKRMIGVAYDVTERRRREDELRERNKELTALHRTAELFTTKDAPRDELLAELAEAIPSWFQAPPETDVRIVYGDTDVSTEGFDQSAETIEAATHTSHGIELRLTVSRRVDTTDDGAFLSEEQTLIDTLASFLCEALERQAREQDRKEYLSLTEAANDVIITIDTDSTIQRVNPAVGDVFGYEPEELTGESLTRLMPEALADRHLDAVDRYLETGERNADWDYLEFTGVRRDGSEIQLAISFSEVEMHGDRYFTGVMRDITEKQERQAEIIRLLDLLRHTERTADVGSWELDPETMELFWSDQLFELVGGSDTDAEPSVEEVLESVHDEDRPTVQEALNAALEDGEPIDEEVRFMMPDGTVMWLHLQGTPEVTDGEVVRLRGAAQDITDRKERERALEESHERLEEFATAVSHDLREPLGTVASYLQLLERRYEAELDEDAEEFIEFAVSGATRMREMIDGLVTTYAQVESADEPVEPVEMDTVLEDVLVDLEGKIERNDAQITSESLPTVSGNRGQVRQLLMNLIDNAIKYAGDAPPRVHVAAERVDDMYRFSVDDEGIGMDPAATERVFDVFSRLHTEEEYPGTGIGLALCERIVERHGGEIWLDSEPGEGSTFWFTLPAAGSTER